MELVELMEKRQNAECATPTEMELVGWLDLNTLKVYNYPLANSLARPVYAFMYQLEGNEIVVTKSGRKEEVKRPKRTILMQHRTDPVGAWSAPTKMDYEDSDNSLIYPILVLNEEDAVHSIPPDSVILTYDNIETPDRFGIYAWTQYRYTVAPEVCPTCEREL